VYNLNYTPRSVGVQLMRNYMWRYANKKGLNTAGLVHPISRKPTTKLPFHLYIYYEYDTSQQTFRPELCSYAEVSIAVTEVSSF
jgi:hypothetical protein